MKRYSGIYEKIYDMDNIRLAHKMARKDKQLYKEVQMVNSNPDFYLKKIQELLKEKKYRITPKDYSVTVIRDRTKSRELWKLKYYPHRIIQWAIMLQLEPIFMQTFTDFSCASVKGKGGKQVRKLMDKYLKNKDNTAYCLKIDIQKFYPSVNHKILKRLLRKKIKDSDMLSLLDMLIDSFPGKRGLPIGSYLSQYLANFYLTYFDHRIKEVVKCKYVIRYMDDIVVLGKTKKWLRYVYRRVKSYLTGKLDLKIKDNRQIFPTGIRGIDYVGYRYFYGFSLLRKRTCKRLKAKAIRLANKNRMNFRERCSINSYIGWILYCNHFRLFSKYISPLIPSLNRYYYYVICNNKIRTIRYYKNLISKQY